MSQNKRKKLKKKAKQKQELLQVQLTQLRELEEKRLSCQNVGCQDFCFIALTSDGILHRILC